MKISVIVPCYNCEKTIEKCLDSLFSQTYNELEVIAVDDGSSDNTLNKLKKIAQKDSRLKIYHQENSGPSSARNLGLSKATGEFVGFIDSDDFIRKDAYEKMIQCACEQQADLIICDYICVYPDNKQTVMRHVLPRELVGHKEIIDKLIFQFYGGDATGLASLCNKLYKRSFIGNMRFDEELYRGEDWWFNLKLYEKANKISAIHESLYYYSQGNKNSIMRRLDSNYYKEWKFARQYLDQKNQQYGFQYDKNMAYAQLLGNIYSLLIAMTKRGENIEFIINDPFYDEIIAYEKFTSKIVKFSHFIHRYLGVFEKYLYKILAIYHKIQD